jgi:hypothetical protein
MMKSQLERIADALERIAAALERGGAVAPPTRTPTYSESVEAAKAKLRELREHHGLLLTKSQPASAVARTRKLYASSVLNGGS